MEESSNGAVVPAVKGETRDKMAVIVAEVGEEKEKTGEEGDLDKEMLCPICMQIIKDAFLTSCGHSFCYMCVVTHLQNKSDCPCCSNFLTPSQLYPNFLLDKLIVIRFLCATFVAIEEEICCTNFKNCIPCRTVSTIASAGCFSHSVVSALGKGLLFSEHDHLRIEAFTNTDWAGSPDDRRLTFGYCTLVGGNLVTWRRKKQSVIARSSAKAEAECRAMAQGV